MTDSMFASMLIAFWRHEIMTSWCIRDCGTWACRKVTPIACTVDLLLGHHGISSLSHTDGERVEQRALAVTPKTVICHATGHQGARVHVPSPYDCPAMPTPVAGSVTR